MKIKALAYILIISLFCLSALAAAEGEPTEIGYRVAPLLEQLKNMTNADIEAAVNKFPDMKTHWSRKTVGKITKLGIIAGRPDGKFGPDEPLMVEHFIKMTVCAMGFKVEPGTPYWAQPYINIAKQYGIIGANEFTNYARPITRQEAAKIIYLATMLKEPAPSHDNDRFITYNILDYQDVGDSYKQYVISTYALGVLCGTPEGRYNPKGTLKRGEGSSIILRNLAVAERTPFIPEKGNAIELPSSHQRVLNVIRELNKKRPEDLQYPESYADEFLGEGYYIINGQDKKEEIQLAWILKKNMSKSRGYAEPIYTDDVKIISVSGYSDKERFMTDLYGADFNFAINFESSNNVQYRLIVSNAKATKELHREYIIEILNYLFGNDASKAIQQFDKYNELLLNKGDNQNINLTLNGRNVFIYKYDNSGFTMRIYGRD